MNKTVFIMDSSGNAVQWAAGMSLETVAGTAVRVFRGAGEWVMRFDTVDPRACVSYFVRALCACPDGSLLEWDEEAGMVGCKTWTAEPETAEPKLVEAPESAPATLPDGWPILRVEGHRKWRELYDDEVIQEGDRASSSGVFNDSVALSQYCLYLGLPVSVYRGDARFHDGVVYRRIKPKKQKAGESQS